MPDLNHKQLSITANFVSAPTDTMFMTNWLVELVEKIDMKILMGPHVTYCNDPGNEGLTGIVCIATSHCAFHIWDKTSSPVIQFDLYSCKDFDPQIVLDHIKNIGAVIASWSIMDRNEDSETHMQITEKQIVQLVPFTHLLDNPIQELYNSYLRKRLTPHLITAEERKAVYQYQKIRERFSLTAQKRRIDRVALLRDIQRKCKKKGLPFDLDVEWLKEQTDLALKKWPLLTLEGNTDSFWYINVDRKIPELGYVQTNCQILPRALNVAKWKWSQEEVEVLKTLVQDL